MTPAYKMIDEMPDEFRRHVLSFMPIHELYSVLTKKIPGLHHLAQLCLFGRSGEEACNLQVKLMISWLRHLASSNSLSFIKNIDDKDTWTQLLIKCMQDKEGSFMHKLCCGLLLQHLSPREQMKKPKTIAELYAKETPKLDAQGLQLTALIAPYFDDQALMECIKHIGEQIRAKGIVYVKTSAGEIEGHQYSWDPYCTILQIAPLLKPSHIVSIARLFFSGIGDLDRNYFLFNCLPTMASIDIIYPEKEFRKLFRALRDQLSHQDESIRVAVLKAIRHLVKQAPTHEKELVINGIVSGLFDGSRNTRKTAYRNLAIFAESMNETQVELLNTLLYDKLLDENDPDRDDIYVALENLASFYTKSQAQTTLNFLKGINADLLQVFKLIPRFKSLEELEILPFIIQGLSSDKRPLMLLALQTASVSSLTNAQLCQIIPSLVQLSNQIPNYDNQTPELLSEFVHKFNLQHINLTNNLLWTQLSDLRGSQPLFEAVFPKLIKVDKIKWIPKIIDKILHLGFKRDKFVLETLECLVLVFTVEQINQILEPILTRLRQPEPNSASTSDYAMLRCIAAYIPLVQLPEVCKLVREKLPHQYEPFQKAAMEALPALVKPWPEALSKDAYEAILPFLGQQPEACKTIMELGLQFNPVPVSALFEALIAILQNYFQAVQNYLEAMQNHPWSAKYPMDLDRMACSAAASLRPLVSRLNTDQLSQYHGIIIRLLEYQFYPMPKSGVAALPELMPRCEPTQKDMLVSTIVALLENPRDWSVNHPLCIAIGKCADADQFTASHLTKLIPAIRPYLWNCHDEVRSAAQNSLGKLISHVDAPCFQILMKRPETKDADLAAIFFTIEAVQLYKPKPPQPGKIVRNLF